MNPYLKKFQYGGKGDPEDPIKDLLNYGLTPQNKQPIYGLPANPYQPASGYSWGSGMPNKPTEVVNTTGSGHSQTMPSVNTFQGDYDPRMPGEKALQVVDKAIGQHIVQPAMELYNTPFATVAEGVNALQGKEASLERALPNPTRIALNAQGIQGDIPNQQFLSDYVGVDREKNPYLALGLDILTPGPAMFAKPIQALTGIGKASKGTMQYASKMNALDRAIDSPLTFIKEEVSPFVSGVNPNLGFKFADQTIDATKALQQADQNVFNAARQPQVAASTTQAVSKEYTPWTQQEMPGLHLKSTMSGSPFEKQLSKTGELNVSNIQAHINRADVSQQDKITLQKVLNNRFAGKQKVDYNEFRKAVQEEAVELRRVPVEEYQHKLWGVNEIGYPGLKQSSYESSIKTIEDDAKYYTKIRNLDLKNQKRNTFYEAGSDVGKKNVEFPGRFRPVENVPEGKVESYLAFLKKEADEFFENTYPKKAEYESALKTMPKVEIMTFENAEKFGTGNAKHFGKSTLGHTRTMVDPEQPGIWHTLEQQSDFWQDVKRIIPSESQQRNWNVKSIMKQQAIQEDMDLLEYMKKNKKTKAGDPVENYQIDQFEEMLLKRQEEFNLQKGDFANPQQKEFLGNAHQERLLQENVKLAAENGMNKVRYPTAETAVKIQKYQKVRSTDIIREYNKDLELVENPEAFYKKYNVSRDDAGYIADGAVNRTLQEYKDNPEKFINKRKAALDKHYKSLSSSGMDDYSRFSDEHETVLRKYKDNQKMIEKTLGVKVNTVTDAKGNTWYEFDIPDAYKQGKAEIKAFSINPILGGGAAGAAGSSMMQQPKEKFRTGGSVNPYLKQYNPGGKVIIDGKEVNTSSQEYKDLYNAGVLMGVDYEGLPNMYAPEVEVTAEAPLWLKQKKQQEQAEYTDEELERYMYQGKKPERDKNFILPPGERLNIYNSVVPYEYPHSEFPKAVKRYINDEKRPYFGQESVKEEGRDLGKVDEDAWAHFMGLPQLYNTVQKSEYFPTNSKDKNAEYYSIRKGYPDFDELLLENANNWFQKKENTNATTLKGVGSPFMPLENVTYSKGQDEKGKYYSMYDIYDFNIPFQKGIGRPYDIYDRVYYDDSNPEKPTLLKNRYGGQNPYIKYANGGPVDPVDPEEEKRLMQERLMKYIRGNNENSTSILDVRAPNEYGISLGDRFNIQSGLSIDPMTGMPSGYGKLGVNSNGFNLGVEKKKGFETDANIFNLGYESPKFNIDASYSNENNMPSIRGNVGYNNNGINIGFGGNYSPDNKSISANIGYNKNGFNAGLNYDYSGQHSMSGNVGYGNDEYNVGLSGNVMPSESNIGLNATYNLGVRKPQKREEISLAYNKPIEINLIKEDNEYEDTDAEQAAGPPEMNYGGYVNPYMKTYGKGGNTKTSEEEVNCTNCGWSWKLSEGGNKPYMCHECNHDNSQEYKETANKQQYEKGGDIGLSTVEIERNERVYTPDGKLIMETPANAPTHEEGGVKVTLPAGSLVFPKKYYKSLDVASGLPAFKKITNTMLDNAEKAYLRGEAYSSGGKRKQ